MLSSDNIRAVAPALGKYTQDRLLGEVWKRPGLSPRDRSIVTLAVLITRNQTVDMPFYVKLALDTAEKGAEKHSGSKAAKPYSDEADQWQGAGERAGCSWAQ